MSNVPRVYLECAWTDTPDSWTEQGHGTSSGGTDGCHTTESGDEVPAEETLVSSWILHPGKTLTSQLRAPWSRGHCDDDGNGRGEENPEKNQGPQKGKRTITYNLDPSQSPIRQDPCLTMLTLFTLKLGSKSHLPHQSRFTGTKTLFLGVLRGCQTKHHP